ncbi:hypothetical protein [Microbulbifer sp. JMSA003]|uniref:hypothetical protein n=1 Tax=Microbulbifer sp. JMSA003 TaxID=3243369 RepID=UPI00403A438B
MNDWKVTDSDRFGPISKIVAIFEVGPPLKDLEIPCLKVKILEKENGRFAGIPNMAVLGKDNFPEWTSGFGKSPEEALIDTLEEFYKIAKELNKVSEEHFVYSEIGDFI